MNKARFIKAVLILLAVYLTVITLPFQAAFATEPLQTATTAASVITPSGDMEKRQSAPATLGATGATNSRDNDGSITGTTDAMEYRRAGTEPWKRCTRGATQNLPAGEYQVRYAAKPSCHASPCVTVSVAQYVRDVTLQPAADETQMHFTWYSKYGRDQQSVVQIALQSDMTGDAFPAASASTFTGENRYSSGYQSNSVIVSGLRPGTDYVYRLGTGAGYSQPFCFSTQDPQDYHFILVGDPQIGASGGLIRDTREWSETLYAAVSAYPDASFILSVGDQVDTAGDEDQYAGFFSPPALASMPLVPTIGNHDVWGTHARHFSPPNESDEYGLSSAGGDYWFTYGSTLFMVLNSNCCRTSGHAAFIAESIAAAGQGIAWKVLVFHHSIYSSASHSSEKNILSLRSRLVPIIDQNGIDVVLMGHDHCYTRTCQMLGGAAQGGAETVAVNPPGTLYITANSASGSKYYEVRNRDTAYSAFHWQGKEPTYSSVAVTGRSFTITTCTSGDNKVIDQYTILKESSAVSAVP